MNVMEQISKVQERLAVAQRDRSRAEGAYETAQAVADSARAELKRDFGVDNLDAGEQLLGDLRGELERIVADLNAALDKIGVA